MNIKTLSQKGISLYLVLFAAMSVLFLPLSSVQAISITDGEAAVNVLGQADFATSGFQGANATSVQSPSHTLFDSVNSRLYVADTGNNRVVIFDTSSISDNEAAVNVLGQASFGVSSPTSGASGMYQPRGLALDTSGNRLFVSEEGNHRILVFDVSSIVDGEAAINVLGQADFTSNSSNRGGAASSSTLAKPQGMAYDSDTDYLYVTDQDNDRFLIYDVSSITDGEAAINVLGQADFTSTVSTTTASGVSNDPGDVSLDTTNNRLFAFDGGNQRILIYDISSITNGEAAVNVLGQMDFVTQGSSPTAINLNGSGGG